MNKFKVGDKIKYVHKDNVSLKIGSKFTVMGIDSDGGLTLGGQRPYSPGYAYNPELFELCDSNYVKSMLELYYELMEDYDTVR